MHKEKKVVEKKEYSLAERLADAAEEEERMAAYSVQVLLVTVAQSLDLLIHLTFDISVLG